MKPFWLYATTVKEGTRPIAWGWAEPEDHALELALRNDAFLFIAKGGKATLSAEAMVKPPSTGLQPSFGMLAPIGK